MEQVKIRCSGLGNLFTEPKLKADKEAGNLSETAKSWLRVLFIEQTTKRKKQIKNKYLEKGTFNEDYAITLLSEIDNKLYIKNKKELENDFIKGTPDIISDIVIDIKCSWDIFTFSESELTNLYEWQLKGYMWLTGLSKAKLAYCLIDTPEFLIRREEENYKRNYFGDELLLQNKLDEIRRNMVYSDIPKNRKLIKYDVELNDSDIELIKLKVIKAREYLLNYKQEYENKFKN